jgi:hypothetical protein
VTNRDRVLLRSMRTVFMVAVAILFLTTPFRVPDARIHNWGGNLSLIGTGLILLYVEASLWYHYWKVNQRRGN